MSNNLRILRLPAVKDLVGLSRSSIYQRVRDGLFPAPIGLGGRCIGWIEHEVLDWLSDRVTTTRGVSSEAR